MLRRLLIANRGEIARRIIRATKELGIESVAVHSTADRDAPFAREADHRICIGGPRASESYLDMEAILEAAALTECGAVHPGYGFLSENALFAEMVLAQRLVWVGPPPRVLRLMGEKAPAKRAMKDAGLPLVPGSDGVLESLEEASEIAESVGYPVLLKADAGGGGRGMRAAHDRAELARGWDEARREAASAFGNDALYLEKLITRCRHIEFQILTDRWGNGVHLFERECSIQRRHQKLLEEAPSVALDDATRNRLGAQTRDALLSVGYEGAGTVELLYDIDSGSLYFMEVNARLQVEHPVTEEITGVDLVQAQLRIALGEKLWFSQQDLKINGHAIELRINAEDPDNGFAPSPGKITRYAAPPKDLAPGRVRVDGAIEDGAEISPFYDSLAAKLIGWGPDRKSAIETTLQGLSAFEVEGIQTTAPMFVDVLKDEAFESGTLEVGRIPGRPELSRD